MADTTLTREKFAMSRPVITRFAPSPTGFLHIGGGRTALFNWLYAKKTGGKMLLRIEDTDRERSTDAAIDAIIDGLKWLGLNWDGETVFQFARAPRHKEAAESLIASGHAYYCYATQQELEDMRELARSEKRPPRYDGRWRDKTAADAAPLIAAGIKPVVRLKAPIEGETVVNDEVQGRVTWANKDLDDLILLRSDGTPTYMLAVVVDDHDMNVTHVIRGDDHLTNAARQTHIYNAFGWEVPVFAHLPLILGPDGAKLSKRHGALGVDAYRAMGYLPPALRNYLVRLGWSAGDQEYFTQEELVAAFDLSGIGRSPSRFDYAKLENMNGHYMRATPDADLLAEVVKTLPYLETHKHLAANFDKAAQAKLLAAMPGLKERAKNLNELLDGAAFLFAQRPLIYDAKAKDALQNGGAAAIAGMIPALTALPEWSAVTTEQCVRLFAEANALKLGQAAQPLRAALTGRLTSPGIFDVLAVLGREESLARLQDATTLA